MRFLDDLALLTGRILMAALLLPSGVKKLMDIGGTTQMLAAKGLPMPEILAIAAGAAETVAPILLVLGLVPRITAILAGGFVLVATLTSHRFWEIADPAMAMGQQIQFLKNIAIVGGTMFYFVSGAGRFALGGKR